MKNCRMQDDFREKPLKVKVSQSGTDGNFTRSAYASCTSIQVVE